MKIKKKINKFLCSFTCLIMLISTFTACNENSPNSLNENFNDSNNSSQDKNNSTSQNNNEENTIDFTNLQYKEYSTTTYHEVGFYEVALNSKGVNNDNAYALIYFHDTNSMMSVPLCNKPDCTHDNDSCNAYFECSKSQEVQPFIVHGKEKIYIVAEQILERDENNHETWFDNPIVIYEMNFDGTNRTQIMTLEPNMRLSFGGVYFDDYFISVQSKMVMKEVDSENGTQARGMAEEKSLVAIDLKKRTLTKLTDFDKCTIKGAYDNKIIYTKLTINSGLPDPDFEPYGGDTSAYLKAYKEYMKGATDDYYIYDLTENTHTELFKKPADDGKILPIKDGYLFDIFEDKNEIAVYDFKTQTEKIYPIVTDKEITSYNYLIDDKYIIYLSVDISNLTDITMYCLNLETKENRNITSIKDEVISIVGEIGDDLVVSMVSFSDGVGFVDFGNANHKMALISKADYIAGNDNYREFSKE